jgi:hypothetical protein
MGLTFQDVWAAMMESRAEHDRMIAETDKKIQENAAQQKKTDQLIKDLGKQMGGLHHSFGELAANLVAPNLVAKFRDLHYTFTKSACEVKFKDAEGITLAEVDVWLENGDYVMAVEIKGKLLQKDVDDHLKRMKILHDYGNDHGDTRKLLGAVAGAIVRKDARDYAVKSGFYVIEQSGDTVKIEMPKGFTPKTW